MSAVKQKWENDGLCECVFLSVLMLEEDTISKTLHRYLFWFLLVLCMYLKGKATTERERDRPSVHWFTPQAHYQDCKWDNQNLSWCLYGTPVTQGAA